MIKKFLVIFTLAMCGLMNVQANVEQPIPEPTEVNSEKDQEEVLISCDKCKGKRHLSTFSLHTEKTLAGCPGCKRKNRA